ncbi:MAG: hypothetical protein PVG32_10405 [Anaerolineales bacterium]|jgi:hypothetical protein
MYKRLGGADYLGPAISPVFEESGVQYQYVVAALMVYDPTIDSGSHLSLAPIGMEIGVSEAPSPPPMDDSQRYLNGHVIYQGFVGLYDQLGGNRIVGLPLSEVHYNAKYGRIEQYFENLGFYQLETDPPSEVHLLDYGVWKCGQACSYVQESSGVVEPPTVYKSPFEEAISRLGIEYTGLPLTEPYVGFDGRLEQIFEYVVVVSDPESPAGISLRPIYSLLGHKPAPLEKPDSADSNMYFYHIENGLGYNIPQHFLEFINRHSGIELSGPPVSSYSPMSDEKYRQCFLNLCLIYSPNQAEGMRIGLSPLGYTYKNNFHESPGDSSGLPFHELTIQVQERNPVASSDQAQEIRVIVMEGEKPIPNLEPILSLALPNGDQKTDQFPPTDENGETMMRISPISALNGTQIDYSVCVTAENGGNFCVRDNYLIWGEP